jgi:ParB-like chromosome segregation protein Spo0J
MPKVSISNIEPYPHQPASRTRDTTALQSSIVSLGLLKLPVVVSMDDGKYRCLSGWRRLTALRAMGETEVSVDVRSDLMDDPTRQVMVFAQSNIQEPWSVLDSADFIKALVDDEGWTLQDAARIRGVSVTEAQHQHRLANAPDEVKELIGRGDGKLAYGTFRSELSHLPPERMLERLEEAGAVTKAALRKARKTAALPERLVESTDAILEVISKMRVLAGQVAVWSRTASPEAMEEVMLALRPVWEMLEVVDGSE